MIINQSLHLLSKNTVLTSLNQGDSKITSMCYFHRKLNSDYDSQTMKSIYFYISLMTVPNLDGDDQDHPPNPNWSDF